MKHSFYASVVFILCFGFCAISLNAAPITKKRKNKNKTIMLSNGSLYDVVSKNKTPYYFTKKYSKTSKFVFNTTYSIYNSEKKATNIVIAVHNKLKHSVSVSVKDLNQDGFPILNVENTRYESPYMGRFGSVGKVGAIGKAKAVSNTPSQLMVKFVNKRYDYVKVISIANAHEDSGQDLQVFVLDEVQ